MRPQYKTHVGYNDEFRRQHEANLREQERQQAALDRANEANRQARLAALEAEREAKRKEADALVEQSLAPDKLRVQREWLAQDASRTTAQFNEKAWPQLRLNILEEKRAVAFEQQKGRMRASGRYTL